MAAKVLTIAQQKGGAGKTTLTAHLAVAFADGGQRVAIVDIDPQASLAHWYRARREPRGVPTTPLTLSAVAGWKLATELDRLHGSHDLILIDSPPHAETDARVAIRSADLVLIPLQPSPMDLWATGPTIALARSASVPILVVLNRVSSRSTLVDLMRAKLGEQHLLVARATITNRLTFASSMLEGRAVQEQAPRSMAAAEIRALVDEITIYLPQ